jgi:hypothetical protein
MRSLRRNDRVIVDHEICEEANHPYYFSDGGKKIPVDGGDTEVVLNPMDRFPQSHGNKDLR